MLQFKMLAMTFKSPSWPGPTFIKDYPIPCVFMCQLPAISYGPAEDSPTLKSTRSFAVIDPTLQNGLLEAVRGVQSLEINFIFPGVSGRCTLQVLMGWGRGYLFYSGSSKLWSMTCLDPWEKEEYKYFNKCIYKMTPAYVLLHRLVRVWRILGERILQKALLRVKGMPL